MQIENIRSPYVKGNILCHGDGERLIVRGVNLECSRYNDSYYYDWFDAEFDAREKIAGLIEAKGFNAVRLNAGVASYEARLSDYSKLESLIELYASKGIYSMPTCHDWTGGIPDVESLKIFFGKVMDNARKAGCENWLILNPWNEGGIYPYDIWTDNCKSFLAFVRREKEFEGPVAFDHTTWAAEFDRTSADEVIKYDAFLRESKPANVIMSNHWYPWTFERYNKYASYCAEYPMFVGELGRWVDAPEPETDVALGFIDSICGRDIPKGHNGIFLWIWRWSDYGSMTDEGTGDGTVLNEDWGVASIDHMVMKATKGPVFTISKK